ncbi:MAG: MogA/MoaB family molybdenum cofactor biosynthesis protein [Cyanobacteria bacterium]|nr:MogA/MoaB family molybdenum cofactor biosynthesis protein [Cyanobacteriota bacterium]
MAAPPPIVPHPDPAGPLPSLPCGVITVSDTRTLADDRSGQVIVDALAAAGHAILERVVLRDEPTAIAATVAEWVARGNLTAILLTGGTGLAPRDTTYEAIAGLLDREIPGFGELFRSLSFQEIGSRAMASRAVAGVRDRTLIFSMPGSAKACRLAMEALILPELVHLSRLLGGS